MDKKPFIEAKLSLIEKEFKEQKLNATLFAVSGFMKLLKLSDQEKYEFAIILGSTIITELLNYASINDAFEQYIIDLKTKIRKN